MSILSEQLYRAYLRSVLGRTHWHRRYYRPSVSVVVGDAHIWFEENGHTVTARPLAALVGSQRGRCNIWLSGPSVKAIAAPERVAEVDWMGVNGSPRVFAAQVPQMRYYHVNDAGFIRAYLDDFLSFSRLAEHVIVDYRGMFELLRLAPDRLSGIDFLVYDSWSYPLYLEKGKIETVVQPPQRKGAFLSKDARLGLPPGGTVAYTGAQALALFGYTSLYFYGLDLSDGGRAYSEANPQPQMLDKSLQKVIIPSFELLVQEYPEIRFRNCNPKSMLPESIVPKMLAEDSFNYEVS